MEADSASKIRGIIDRYGLSMYETKRIYQHNQLVERLNNANDINELKKILKEIIDRILPSEPK